MSQPSVSSTSSNSSSSSSSNTFTTTSSTTSRTSSFASNTFCIHFEDMDEEDVLSVDIEVDIYLLEHRIAREVNFDILEWWKENSSRYKVLS